MSEGVTPPQTRQSLARRVAFICAALVVGIFGSYEVVERLWLHNADAELLHVLHLVRGITCSAIVGVMVTVLLLRRFPSVFLENNFDVFTEYLQQDRHVK